MLRWIAFIVFISFTIPLYANNTLLLSTVRLGTQNITDDQNKYGGSGVIIDIDESKEEATILSCAHIVDHQPHEDQFIKVEQFELSKDNDKLRLADIARARVVKYDNNLDLSILKYKYRIKPPTRVIATAEPKLNSSYSSTGCPELRFPMLMTAELISIDKYGGLEHKHKPGHYNCYELAVLPHLGRSGGPLFNEEGEVIGILSYRFDGQARCVFVGLKEIRKIIND